MEIQQDTNIVSYQKIGQRIRNQRKEMGLSQEDIQAIIDNIRMRDRQMQGVTLEQEAQAKEAVEKLGEIDEIYKEYPVFHSRHRPRLLF